MAGLIPFNRKNNSLARTDTGFEDFYNMLDDFFNDSWIPGRSWREIPSKSTLRKRTANTELMRSCLELKKKNLSWALRAITSA